MNILVINGSPKGEKILPAIMGIFTEWFQKWYLKYVASGK